VDDWITIKSRDHRSFASRAARDIWKCDDWGHECFFRPRVVGPSERFCRHGYLGMLVMLADWFRRGISLTFALSGRWRSLQFGRRISSPEGAATNTARPSRCLWRRRDWAHQISFGAIIVHGRSMDVVESRFMRQRGAGEVSAFDCSRWGRPPMQEGILSLCRCRTRGIMLREAGLPYIRRAETHTGGVTRIACWVMCISLRTRA